MNIIKIFLLTFDINSAKKRGTNCANNVPIAAPIMPLPFEFSRMPVNPIEVQRPNPVPISTLISALTSASPKERNEACNIPPINDDCEI